MPIKAHQRDWIIACENIQLLVIENTVENHKSDIGKSRK